MKKLLILASVLLLAGCAHNQADSQKNQNSGKNLVEKVKTNNNNQENPQTNQEAELKNKSTIDSQKENDIIKSPVNIYGKTSAKKNKLYVQLRDSEHQPKVSVFAVVDENNEKVNDYHVAIDFKFNSTKEGYLAVFEIDENTGEEKNITEIPVAYSTK